MSAGIREVVTSEKADLLNTGTVKDAEGQSASTLAQRESAATQRQAAARPIQAAPSPAEGKRGKSKCGKDPIDADRHAADVARKPAKLERAKVEAKSAAMSALVGELDDSEELSDTQRVYDAARAGKRIAARAKARKSLGQEGGKSNGAAARSRVPGVGAKTATPYPRELRRRARPPRWRPGPTPKSGLPQEPRNPRPQPPALPAPQRPRPQRGSSPECSCSS